MDNETRAQVDGWIVEQILLAKATWLHAFYRTMLPRKICDLAGQDDLAKPMAYAREQGFSIHEYASAHGGETQIHKGLVIVAKFKPVLRDGPEHVMLSFEATVLGKQVPCASLTEGL